MRFKNLFLWDMRFQKRYGFYLLYTFLTILYALLILSFPKSWKENAAALLIFSDPAAMGLFFMGAIVLLEKSQRVTSFFAITPLRASEYVCSKVFSLSVIAMAVAGILAAFAESRTVLTVLLGTFLGCAVFTLAGIIVATRISSLNQFILMTVPVEIIGFVPAILHLFGADPKWAGMYPTNACMDLIAGRRCSIVGMILVIVLTGIMFRAACICVSKMWQEQGGVKI